MMNANHPTRRRFLANMAVVSAGTTFRPFTQLLSTEKSPANLHRQWAAFCQRNGSVSLHGFTAVAEVEPCKGHRHEVGSAVCFENENLLAQPTWIYWKEGNKRPDDVVISFFEIDGERKKAFRLNRFELESLNRLQTTEDSSNCLALFVEAQRSTGSVTKSGNGLHIKTSVGNQTCSSTVTLSINQRSTENKFIHTI